MTASVRLRVAFVSAMPEFRFRTPCCEAMAIPPFRATVLNQRKGRGRGLYRQGQRDGNSAKALVRLAREGRSRRGLDIRVLMSHLLIVCQSGQVSRAHLNGQSVICTVCRRV